MSQNKANSEIYSTFSLGSKILFFFVLIAFSLYFFFSVLSSESTLAARSYDTIWYARLVDENPPSTWQSIFFIYEMKMLVGILRVFITTLPAWCGIVVFSVMCTVVSISCVWWLISSLCPDALARAVALIVFAACYTLCHRVFFYSMYLDSFFISFLLLATVSMLQIRRSGSATSRLKWACVFLLALMHIAWYRANAILVIPGFCLMFLRCWSSNLSFVRQCGVAALITVLIASSGMVGKQLLPHRLTYPMTPMLVGDLKIEAILLGNTDEYKALLSRCGLAQNPTYDGVIYQDLSVINQERLGEDGWKELKSFYVQEWMNHAPEMLHVKALDVATFFSGGYIPCCIQRYICQKFPLIKLTPTAWRSSDQLLKEKGVRVTFAHVMASISVILGVSFLVTLLVVRKDEKGTVPTVFYQHCLLFILVYACSFIPVTPSPMSRYLSPAVMMSLISVSVCLGNYSTSRRDNGVN